MRTRLTSSWFMFHSSEVLCWTRTGSTSMAHYSGAVCLAQHDQRSDTRQKILHAFVEGSAGRVEAQERALWQLVGRRNASELLDLSSSRLPVEPLSVAGFADFERR